MNHVSWPGGVNFFAPPDAAAHGSGGALVSRPAYNERSIKMRIRIIFMFLISVALLGASVFSEAAPRPEPSRKAVYAKSVRDILHGCDFKCMLSNSNSENLQQVAHEACRRSDFIRNNKNSLLEKMEASTLEPKTYKVKLFIDHAYRNLN
ncbi:MAG: hypothetical protein PVG78_12740 [Desulfobacterales bacterium]|jgi:hypothetical protein